MLDDKMVLRARGKQAKAIGEAWEREWIADFCEATKIRMRRQLRENRQGNLGDIEIHERVPMVFQCRKRQKVSVWRALEHASEVADPRKLYPVAVVQDRKGSFTRTKNCPECGQKTVVVEKTPVRRIRRCPDGHQHTLWSRNPRAIGMYLDDFDDMLETFAAHEDAWPGIIIIDRKGKRYPRVWDGLEEAQRLVETARSAHPVIPICQGLRKEGRTIMLIDYEGFLRIVGLLYNRNLW